MARRHKKVKYTADGRNRAQDGYAVIVDAILPVDHMRYAEMAAIALGISIDQYFTYVMETSMGTRYRDDLDGVVLKGLI